MRKVLVITYYWPPAGGPGVQRWLKFVKYLRDFDIDPIVYIPENPNYPITDESLLSEVPKGIKTYQHPIREPYRLASIFSAKRTRRISSGIIQTQRQSLIEKIMLWIRGNFFIPDARKNWVKPSVEFLTGILSSENIDILITTGPPHSLHLIGKALKQRHGGLKWVADFRDPWTSIGYHKKLRLTESAKRKHQNLERQVLNTADIVLVTSTRTKKEFQALSDVPIQVITNGYDVPISTNATLDTKFSISHIGSLLTGRSPHNLWSALKELTEENKAFEQAFELHLVGVVSEDVLADIYAHGLEPYVRLTDYLPHQEAVQRQRQSQVLLLIEINSEETVGIVPGKVFEYLAAKRPLLAVGPTDWDAGDIIGSCGAGQVFDYQAGSSSIKETIGEWFGMYRENKLHIPSKYIEQYSRKQLTAKLADILQQLS